MSKLHIFISDIEKLDLMTRKIIVNLSLKVVLKNLLFRN